MPQKISELFRDHETGLAAVAALKEQGFSDSDIQAVSAEPAVTADAAETDTGDLADSLAAHGISGPQANDVAAGIKRGGYLVTVEPPFGQARRAISILQSFGPVDPEAVPPPALARGAAGGNDPAPVSEALGLGLLWNDPTPLSSLLHWPVLSKEQTPKVNLWSNRAAPLSDALGLPTLIRDKKASASF
jgi:hypothetical protein